MVVKNELGANATSSTSHWHGSRLRTMRRPGWGRTGITQQVCRATDWW